jgi:hypothetical protein
MHAIALSIALQVSALMTNQPAAFLPAAVPQPVEWYGFADTNGVIWPTDNWTNSWQVVALTSLDINLPLSQWTTNAAKLQPHNGSLCFSLPKTAQRQFVRALYIYEGDGL